MEGMFARLIAHMAGKLVLVLSRRAQLLPTVGLSTGIFECFHNTAASFPSSKQDRKAKDTQEQGRSYNAFMYNVAFYYIYWSHRSAQIQCKREEWCEYQ